MFEIVRYKSENEAIWNSFVSNSKNGTFLFNRGYMDYHRDRFNDHSLMIFKDSKLYALFPANEEEDVIWSHHGLTYGGVVTNEMATAADMIELFAELNGYYKLHGFKKVIYKPIPWEYHSIPAQEDIYALFRTTNFRLIGCNIGSVINGKYKIKFKELRRRGVKKALKNGLIVEKSDNIDEFWSILEENLYRQYGAKPVHTVEEIKLLKSRFPDNICLISASKDGIMLGGTLLFIFPNVVHTQYISANEKGKQLGALDLVFDQIVNTLYADFDYIDFGTSNEQNGLFLNESLIFQKEGFGGRGVVYNIFEYDL